MTHASTPSSSDSRGWILAALMATMALAAMDATIVSTAIPQIVGDLGGFSLFTWVFSIYLLAQTVTIPVYGKLADQYGRKPVLLIGTTIFLLGSAACALSWNMVSLIIFRIIQGLGAGSIMATVNTLAGDLYEVKDRGKVQGWLSSVWGVSAIIGPTLGGAFADYLSWRWIFLINVPVGAVSLWLIHRYLHESLDITRHKVDYAGSILILLTTGLLVFGLLQGGIAWPWLSHESLLILLAVMILALITLLVERRAAEPVLPGWLWRRRVLTGSNLAMVAMGIAMMGPITYLPTFAQSVHGLGAIAAGLTLAVMSIGWPLASAISPRLYMVLDFRNAAVIGGVLMVTAGGLFLLIPANASIVWVVLDQFILGAGLGLLSTPLLVGIQSVVGWHQRGQVTGANMFSRFLGQSLGAAIFGAIFNAVIQKNLAQLADTDLPDLNHIVSYLHGDNLPAHVVAALKTALADATYATYLGVALFSLAAILLTCLTPRKFPLVEELPK